MKKPYRPRTVDDVSLLSRAMFTPPEKGQVATKPDVGKPGPHVPLKSKDTRGMKKEP